MVYLRAGVVEETGTAYFDSLQLEDGNIANRYNLVENADFKYSLANWTKNTYTDANDVITTAGGAPGLDANTFKMTGIGNKSKNIYQIINVSGKANEVFSIGGWAKGNSVAAPGSSGRFFALDIAIKNTDGTYQYKAAYFNEDSTDWQYASEVIKTEKPYDYIIVYGLYYNNANYVYFDGMQLYKEEFSESYTVNTTTGNMEKTESVANRKSTFTYNTKNELIKAVDPNAGEFNYDYKDPANGSETHRLYKATTAENVVYSFSYDGYGNPITASVGDASGPNFTSNATYTDGNFEGAGYKPGNYIKSVKNPDGNEVIFNYNEKKGVLDSIVDAKGDPTSYIYDPLTDMMNSVSKNADGKIITNGYTYKDDKLETITHNGFSYVFGYDSLGRVKTITAGGQNLITNIYNPVTGNLEKSLYGNGNTFELGYDDLDRVKSQKYGGVDKYTFEYDGSGNLGYEKDIENEINYRYSYDLANRLSKIVGVDKNNNIETNAKYEYDLNSNVSGFSETVNGEDHSASYVYDKDNKIKEISLGEDNKINYSYDSIGRLKDVTTTIRTTTFTASYVYTDANNINKAKLQKLVLPGNRIMDYTYDKNGNIESIAEGSKKVIYKYNELNELIREDNGFLGEAGKTIVYSYDVGGNILSKKEYPLTQGDALPGAVKSYDYGYQETGWKDLLKTITVTESGASKTYSIDYDGIGNPTKIMEDGNVIEQYTWEGRQLRGYVGDGNNITYKYNSSGIRTEKTIGNKTTKYHLIGDRVTYQETIENAAISDRMYFIYSGTGKLVAMKLNGVQYNYIKNAQGDIVGLMDTAGNEVVTYSYDSWGKLESIDGEFKDTLGVLNPYRYRGYRYDTETGLYYLQSRYYNPEWGRFINADAIIGQTGELLGHNMFAYTKNNPVNASDPSGFRTIEGAGVGGSELRPLTESNFNYATNIKESIISGGLDYAVGKTVNKVIKERMIFKPIGTWTISKSVSSLSKGAKIGKGVLGLGGSIAFASFDVISSIQKGEYMGAIIDVGSAVAGILAGAIIGAGAALLITASTPVLLAGAIAAASMGVSIVASVYIDKYATAKKNEYYGR